jgi:hypothetical protein
MQILPVQPLNEFLALDLTAATAKMLFRPWEAAKRWMPRGSQFDTIWILLKPLNYNKLLEPLLVYLSTNGGDGPVAGTLSSLTSDRACSLESS